MYDTFYNKNNIPAFFQQNYIGSAWAVLIGLLLVSALGTQYDLS